MGMGYAGLQQPDWGAAAELGTGRSGWTSVWYMARWHTRTGTWHEPGPGLEVDRAVVSSDGCAGCPGLHTSAQARPSACVQRQGTIAKGQGQWGVGLVHELQAGQFSIPYGRRRAPASHLASARPPRACKRTSTACHARLAPCRHPQIDADAPENRHPKQSKEDRKMGITKEWLPLRNLHATLAQYESCGWGVFAGEYGAGRGSGAQGCSLAPSLPRSAR